MKMRFLVVYTSILLLVGTVVGRVVYRYFADPITHTIEETVLNEISEQKLTNLVEREGVFETGQLGMYDFSLMIDLVDAAKELKRRLREALTHHKISNHHSDMGVGVDLEAMHILLRQLEVERSKLRDYIGDLKGHVRSGLPIKKERSLQYYMQVLEGAIVDVREVMQSKIVVKGKS